VSLSVGQDEVAVRWDDLRVSDNDAVASVRVAPPSGSLFPVGDTRVFATVEDASGNQASCNFTVSILPSTDASLSQNKGETNTAVIAGSVTGVLVMLAIFAIVLVALQRRQRNVNKAPQNWAEIFALMDQFKVLAGHGPGPVAPREINQKAIRLLHELGRGAFGLVSQGLLQETVSLPGYMVAVKSLLPSGQVCCYCSSTKQSRNARPGVDFGCGILPHDFFRGREGGVSRDAGLSDH